MVSIGVSGHRYLIDLAAVSNAVDKVLNKIITFFGGDLHVISSLAEGADRVVVWRAMAYYSVSLVVPLPLEASDYMLDFKSASSKAAFKTLLRQADQIIELPTEDTREASYLAAGMYVLDHSDVLVAIWDGAPARGIGGTADIVTEARQRGMPIAWVQIVGRERESSSVNNDLTGVLPIHYERFPTQLERRVGGL